MKWIDRDGVVVVVLCDVRCGEWCECDVDVCLMLVCVCVGVRVMCIVC